jgi:hypothetical protein
MGLRIFVAGMALASMALAASAFAAPPSHPGEVILDGSGLLRDDPNRAFVAAHVESPKAKCERNRTIKVSFEYGFTGDFRLVDVAKSGRSGAFAAEGRASRGGDSLQEVDFKLKRKVVGRKGHRHVCKSADNGYSGGLLINRG